MTFKRELAEAVMDGRKSVTRRLVNNKPKSPYYWNRGPWAESIAIQPGRAKKAIGRARVVEASISPLARLNEDEARAEGFDSVEAFEQTFADLNDGEYSEGTPVWVIHLEAIS